MLSPLLATDAMSAVFSDRARLQGMLDFEAALARAEAAVGLIPAAAAEAIARACVADNFDLADLAQATAQAGNPAIPMVKQLTALVEKADASAARFVHWGATSQDATDTGLVLQMRAALASLEEDLRRLSDALAVLAGRHARTHRAAASRVLRRGGRPSAQLDGLPRAELLHERRRAACAGTAADGR